MIRQHISRVDCCYSEWSSRADSPGIVVVLTGKDGVIDVQRMRISNGMLIGVPPPEAEVETTHERDITVDNA